MPWTPITSYNRPYKAERGDVSATARLEFRVTPDNRARIERAAEIAGEPVTAFARSAAEQRAEKILREYEATTTVPTAYFDELLAAFDAPAQPNPALTDAVKRLGENVVRD